MLPINQIRLWLLATGAAAVPAILPRAGFSINEEVLLAIAPSSACCNNANASYRAQCRTAKQAAPAIQQSFAIHNITMVAEAAALISLMAFESVEFAYNHNISPGRPGQGTRNMQMINFNLQYAQSVPQLQGNLSSVLNGATNTESFSSDTSNAVLNLLTSNDTIDFGSAAWFLSTQCKADTRTALQSGSEAGWTSYLMDCIGTTVTDDRKKYWTAAIAALQ